MPVTGPAFMMAYLVVSVLLALNMLIAMMATTFERVREQSASNYMFLTAMVISSSACADLVPPPIQLLSAPYWSIKLVKELVACVGWKHGVTQVGKLENGYNKLVSPERQARARPSFSERQETFTRQLKSHHELREHVEKYLEEHGAEASEQDQRWRARIFKEFGEQKSAQKKQSDEQKKQSDELIKLLAELKELRLEKEQKDLVALVHLQGESASGTAATAAAAGVETPSYEHD